MITYDEDGLVIDLPLSWRIAFDGTLSRFEWGIGVSVYYCKDSDNDRHVGIYLFLLPLYLTVDIWRYRP